jgi:all-trans-retinol 13,14-reductase
VPYERFAAWQGKRWKKRGPDYEAMKDRLARQILDILYARVPQAKGRVGVYELSTPLTTQHFANYASGELYGLDHTPQRFEQRWLRPRTKIPGLFLTGQDIASCGVAGALMGGVLTASNVLGKNLLAKIAAAPSRPEEPVEGEEHPRADTMPSAA